jgi:hypothetical protein
MDQQRRATKLNDLEASITETEECVRVLEGEMGDPEAVVDVNGRLPADRRELS